MTILCNISGCCWATTGISAFERFDTIKAINNPNKQSSDFKRPGQVFPYCSSGRYFRKNKVILKLELSSQNYAIPILQPSCVMS
ncbi:3,4-dihydroxy-2-butanone-4-phosphate synthase [Neobacillus niacini]|uniref:3,4-dihydroxy-2-butanone-4-phosphate synthase n=1 Tax=Neobacillus niacini TaxID=86668 RepID=UPI00358F4347